ncbi:MAG: thiamine phosphate synthase [Gammaproteobacteria bacterium]|nr:thiamine phosphate synthase [Gammaproteobacteria bacterium]
MKIRGLYLVTPDWDDTARLCTAVDAALTGGAAAVQYRHKHAAPEQALRQARELLAICRRHGRPLVINDSVELMLAAEADGVHLGRDDEHPRAVRERIGSSRYIGVSCYDDFERAVTLAPFADQVAFGSVFLSQVKPGAVRAPLERFGQARARGLSAIAIGGIDGSNAATVIAAGADALAVITAVFGAADVTAAARQLAAQFDVNGSSVA